MSRLWPGRPIEEVDSSDSEAETVNRVSPTAVQKSPESHKPSSHKPESHKSGVSTKQPDRHSDTQRDDRSVQRADTHQDTHRDKQVESDDSDDERLRRERIRQRRSLMEQEDAPTRRNPILEPKPDTSPTHQPTAPAATEAQQKGLSSEEETESTDSSSEDEYPKRVLIRPVFVKKNERETIAEKQKRLELEEQARKTQEIRLQERKQETSEMVMEELRKEMQAMQEEEEDLGVDDTDGLDEDEEHQMWKLRELQRLMRDRALREQRVQEEADKERRRKMTDKEVEEENERLGKNKETKGEYKFLQKYYHKGAFFAEDEKVKEALDRTDASAPTLEDHQDKSVLPEVLQVKNFGKRGRTKYTHLTDQDTTQFGRDATWSNKDFVPNSISKKMGGMKDGFEKPQQKRLKKS